MKHSPSPSTSTAPAAAVKTTRPPFQHDHAAMTLPSKADLMDAVEHLTRSDKGQAALKALGVFIEETLGLDTVNQRACRTLLSGAWGPYTGTTRDLIADHS